MPSSEYSNAIGGGLKLKGAKDSSIKKKKKKPTTASTSSSSATPTADPAEPESTSKPPNSSDKKEHDPSAIQKALADEERDSHNVDTAVTASGEREAEVKQYGKTEAQRRWEERRRKRLDERLKREGVKTHKQRVEELNKYLSGLSEHHDMPRIGPG